MTTLAQGVQDIVRGLLPKIDPPYTEDVTHDLFLQLEDPRNQKWKDDYDRLRGQYGAQVVNSRIAQSVATECGFRTKRGSKKGKPTTKLINSYSKLFPL